MRDIFIAGTKVLSFYFIFNFFNQLLVLGSFISSSQDTLLDSILNFSFVWLVSELLLSLVFAFFLFFKSNYLADKFKFENSIEIKIDISPRELLKIGILLVGVFYLYHSLNTIYRMLVDQVWFYYGESYLVWIKFFFRLWVALIPIYIIFRVDRIVDFLYRKEEQGKES